MYDNDNIFAKILRGEIPSDKVFEDDKVYAFKDISACAPAHILVVPKGEYISFDDFVTNADAGTVDHFFKSVKKIANDAGLAASGYRLITNHGQDASQSVPHFHIHVIGGKPLGGLIPGDADER